jgi:hypothetical protein
VNCTDKNYWNPGGILGIGLIGFQTIAAQTGQPIPGLLDQMKAEQVITASTYGIYLGGQCELILVGVSGTVADMCQQLTGMKPQARSHSEAITLQGFLEP